MNELITNSMKYAFVGRDEGVIKVSVSLNNNRAILVFEDNGNGVPPSVDIENSTGFGLHLVKLLAKQLKGSIRLERQEGAQFILEFEV
jgi:two-component sensor histidine kinase